MRDTRRRFRIFLGQFVGVQGDLQIWWTPQIPVVYIGNPKAGCSTIKHSLKEAQADAYDSVGRTYARTRKPHVGDDCLRRDGLLPADSRERYLITCVRNPFTRALSAYLDKVQPIDGINYPELHNRKISCFEDYLRALTDANPKQLNSHFRAQHYNLDFPNIAYDAIFYLENLLPMTNYVSQIYPKFQLEKFAPHSRSAAEKLRTHYSKSAIRLVRTLYAQDFELFGYSDELEDAGLAPGKMIAEDRVVPHEAAAEPLPSSPRQATSGNAFETTLRYRRLIDLRLI